MREEYQSNSDMNNSNENRLLPPAFFQQMSQEAQANQQGMNNPFGMTFPFAPGVPPPSFPAQSDITQKMNMFNQSMNVDGVPPGFQPFNNNQLDNSSGFDKTGNDEIEEIGRRDGDRKRRRRSRSRSNSRSKSRSSHSRSARGQKRHNRSRSRDRKEEREREKERMRRGLPTMKREHLSVCTTTLWVGHLSKLVSQEELSDTFGAYGDIVSIDLISSRGCAFIVMNRRQDACRALDRLRNAKLQNKTITVSIFFVF